MGDVGGTRKDIRYTTVILRETSVADERWAVQQAERVVMVKGAPKLLMSDSEYRLALTLRHCDAFECGGLRLEQSMLSLDLLGKLSNHDLGLIETRVFLIQMAAQLRYGVITQAQFDSLLAQPEAAAPQPVGEAQSVGQVAAESEFRPALLADYAGAGADGAVARLG